MIVSFYRILGIGCRTIFKAKTVCCLCGVTTCGVHVYFKSTNHMTENNINTTSEKKQACEHEFSWLGQNGPQFGVAGKNVHILHEPSEFFQKLKEFSEKATKRITLASLYIGTGPLEQQFISCIYSALQNSNGKLKVKVLVDFTRGSRGEKNTRTLLLPLLKDFPCNVQVALYHTPSLRGWIRNLLPERWNETIGLSHLKVYLFDDTIILSGANLSDQYFTNRQDRYVVFNNCPNLAEFFDNLVNVVSTFSFQLKNDNTVRLHHDWKIHPYEGDQELFVKKANENLKMFICPSCEKMKNLEDNDITKHFNCSSEDQESEDNHIDTWVYPLLQMFPLGVRQDEKTTEQILMQASPNSIIKLASGYFNLTDHYMDIILDGSVANYSILMASPKVNGFYGASGMAGSIPTAYTQIAKEFYEHLKQKGQNKRIQLMEYYKEKWTFHVKGLWFYLPGEILPTLSLIGSPNFGYRSVYRDLEAQVAIVTHNSDLQKQLHKEQERLYHLSSKVDDETFQRPDRQVPWLTKLVTMVVKTYF